jgi:hypothetical protein
MIVGVTSVGVMTVGVLSVGSHDIIPLIYITLTGNTYNKNIYLTLCTFSFEIKESSLSDTRCCITTLWRDIERDVLCRALT